MKTYTIKYKNQKFRELLGLAIALKESYDLKESDAQIEIHFDRYYKVYEWLYENIPKNILKGTDVHRSTKFMHYYIKKRRDTDKCEKDIRKICYKDLIVSFQRWIESTSLNS